MLKFVRDKFENIMRTPSLLRSAIRTLPRVIPIVLALFVLCSWWALAWKIISAVGTAVLYWAGFSAADRAAEKSGLNDKMDEWFGLKEQELNDQQDPNNNQSSYQPNHPDPKVPKDQQTLRREELAELERNANMRYNGGSGLLDVTESSSDQFGLVPRRNSFGDIEYVPVGDATSSSYAGDGGGSMPDPTSPDAYNSPFVPDILPRWVIKTINTTPASQLAENFMRLASVNNQSGNTCGMTDAELAWCLADFFSWFQDDSTDLAVLAANCMTRKGVPLAEARSLANIVASFPESKSRHILAAQYYISNLTRM